MEDLFNEDYLIRSEDYAAVLETAVLPALQKRQEDRTVPGKDRMPLFCSCFRADNPVGTVLLLHGFTENAYKYSELIWSLLQNRFCVIAYDQRGHGRSGRSDGLKDSSVTHVDRFQDYVEDLSIVCDTVLPDFPKPWTLFSHSMGGAVASLYLENHRETFSAAVLCAPMIAPNTHGVPAAAASFLCRLFCLFGRGKRCPFFLSPYSGPEKFETSCATDPARFAWYDQVKFSREDFRNSVPSYRWTLEAIGVTRKILAPGAPESIACPVLLSSADADFSVMPAPQKEFIARIPRGKHIFVKNSRHEIYRSLNEELFPWWHENLLFLKEAQS